MNHDDIIRMAREAGLLTIGTADGSEAVYTWPKGITEELKRFAELVRADEREVCAKVCESMTLEWEDQPSIAQAELATMMDCALSIRARGQA